MSVINKMLRDLDSRQPTPAAGTTRQPPGQHGLTAGTMAVGGPSAATGAPANKRGLGMRMGLLVLLLGLMTGLGWWANQRTQLPAGLLVTATPPVAQTAEAPAQPVQPANAAVPAPAPAPAVAPATPPAAPAIATAPVAAAARVKAALQKPVETPAVAKALPAKLPTGHLKEETELSSIRFASRSGPEATAVVPRSVTRPAAAAIPDAPKVRAPATQEVLAQAQERWNLGERAPAIALLQGAITRLEGAGATEVTALAALTREYVRMTLAQGQASAASAMLTRLEGHLGSVADIWALRGNVAQRLGHHPEAVRAYLKSLELRPNEPRWMLGAAVSLAAQGQLGPAGDLAEQARQAGGLRPDVANYLRQLGVAVRPD